MSELSDYGITLTDVGRACDGWRRGAKRNDLDRRYLTKPESHGELFASLAGEQLGIETEQMSNLTVEPDELAREVVRLMELPRWHGLDPEAVR